MVEQVPVVVLAGFLGAGKTTVLNQLLRSASDVRLGVLVNDFGVIGIDALLVAGGADSTVSLENGCLCCTTADGSVDELLSTLVRRPEPLDAIVVEASGVAEPAAMVRQVLASTVPGVTYGGLVVVVDAVEFAAARQRHPVLADHVGAADVVLLTKTDLVEPAAVPGLVAACRALNPWAPVVPAARGELDARLLFDRPRPRQRQLALGEVVDGVDAPAEHLHTHFDSVEFTAEAPLDPRAFVAFLDARPSGVFRVKGFVHFAVRGHEQRHVLHVVGAAVRFTRDAWPADRPRRTEIVCVGAGFDADELLAGLRACVRTGPLLEDEMAVMGVLRSTDAG